MTTGKLFTYVLKPEDHGKKYEDILRRRFCFSAKLIQRLKIGEKVWVDGKFTFLNVRGQAGQTLVANIEEEEIPTIRAEHLPLEILFEDSFFLAVNKPPGQVVHPTRGYQTGTLANAVTGYWLEKGEPRIFRPVFRIDKNTSGLVLIAKSRYTHHQMNVLTARNKIVKKYLGLVQGQFPRDEGQFDQSIRLKNGSFIQREVHEEGQSALTLYRTLKRYEHFTLMEFSLITGRTHQIRVHCQHSGYPLLGDDLYGGDTTLITRQALHCYYCSFPHPLNGEPVVIKAPLPKDMLTLLGPNPDQELPL
ncbi:MAG: RluA family pseudouridine synthase [Peptococcaceae bacterium]|nr:RluA family pseudouridine synthase [Peptococcaceae bacterium]